ncbi:tRNA lysidine(34) synthetase TilS [Sporolactobacillus shoreicorticis]|uniref:tRNA(Ile)-lysidine synthase n=1 Tax=Sporolactobacillus shoreicorticis TaxID=1923877 RepID=A0ABW5S7V7_9BACL|nr:tRNA lysidine(34) synthetase TilS [Sporolactobacillus shoreicorticis]MCO7127744.1 tRNA lysidine(34) synthetase TilS [Sporolactobacillus shoreicorticis]
MTFSERVTRFIGTHHLVRSNERLVLGVSGGADSMALLHFFYMKKKDWELELAVCSVDHTLRGVQSNEDQNYVASFCKKREILFIGKTVDARSWSAKRKISIETGARELRYKAFAEAMAVFKADALVLAHHGDDQIETMLMRQVRGTIGVGRAGIPVRRPFEGKEIIRPFLSQTKADLERYCSENGIVPRHDESNESDAHTRNRFRKNVLPFLKKENPQVHLKFQYESERIAEDESLLLQMAENRLERAVLDKKKCEYALSVPEFLDIHPALQRRTIHLLLCYLYTNRQLQPPHQSIHIEQLLQLLHSSHSSGSVILPKGLTARRSYDRCRIGFVMESGDIGEQTAIPIPGRTDFLSGSIEAAYLKGEELSSAAYTRDCFILDGDHIALPLYVRTWRVGDRISPNGMTGSQKIQRIFINEKIDRNERTKWPLITDANGRILWLPLLRRGMPFPSSPDLEKKNYIKLQFIPFTDFGRTQE